MLTNFTFRLEIMSLLKQYTTYVHENRTWFKFFLCDKRLHFDVILTEDRQDDRKFLAAFFCENRLEAS